MITLKQLMEAIERREEELKSQKETKKRQGKKAAIRVYFMAKKYHLETYL